MCEENREIDCFVGVENKNNGEANAGYAQFAPVFVCVGGTGVRVKYEVARCQFSKLKKIDKQPIRPVIWR